MAKYKTEFELEVTLGMEKKGKTASALIAFPGTDNAYLSIQIFNPKSKTKKGFYQDRITLRGKSLERLARNILKSLGKK